MRKPNYAIVRNVPGETLVVRDLGPWDKFPTITNAAEELVADLDFRGLLPEGRKLHYYDSEGQLDGIRVGHHDGTAVFTGFYPGPTRSQG